MPAPVVLDDHVQFRPILAPLDGHPLEAVRLELDRAIPGARDFAPAPLPEGLPEGMTAWQLDLPRPALQRLEYKLNVAGGGHADTWIDPDNADRVGTAFGDKSVVAMPGYRPPAWLEAEAVAGDYTELDLVGELAAPVPITVWSPRGIPNEEPLPLLFAHDGPEYDRLSGLTQWSGAMIAASRVPAHRVALVQPVLRDAWYSGSPEYLRSEAGAGLEHLAQRFALRGPVVVMGASLGGLTSLLVGLLSASGLGVIGGVFAQSGSFFTVKHDGIESNFPYFGRITEAVQQVLEMDHVDHPLRVAMTCGSLEENVKNNREMAAALGRTGHDVRYAEVPDLHNYTGWRDALDPYLTDLVRACWGAP